MATGSLYRSLVGLWILVFGLIYGVEAVLKTTFIEDICSNKKSVAIDLRYESTGIIMSVPQTETEKPFDCEIVLLPPKFNSVVLSIYRYDVSDGDLLTIEDSDRHKIALMGWGNFKDERKSFISEGKMAIRYRRESSVIHPRQGFQFTFTKVNNGPCYDNEFHCNNKKCILKEYLCDGHNHCGDGSDLKKCVPKEERITAANEEIQPPAVRSSVRLIWIIIVAIAGLVLLIIVIVFIVVVARQSKRRKQAASAPIAETPGGGGNLPLQSVSSTVPQQIPEASQGPSAPPAPEESQETSFYGRVRQSLRGTKIPKVEEAPTHQERVEVYQVPSMYPSLGQVTYEDEAMTADGGIENPEFKIDE